MCKEEHQVGAYTVQTINDSDLNEDGSNGGGK